MMTFSPLTLSFAPVPPGAVSQRRSSRTGAGKLLLLVLAFLLPLLPFASSVAQAAPAVVFTSPANNAVVTRPPANGSYSFTWTNVPAGTYSLTAQATDSAQQTGVSPVLSIVASKSPQVALSSPAANTAFDAPTDILLTATASAADTPGTHIQRVDFYVNWVLIGPDTEAPYTFLWERVPAGRLQPQCHRDQQRGSARHERHHPDHDPGRARNAHGCHHPADRATARILRLAASPSECLSPPPRAPVSRKSPFPGGTR